MLCVSIDLESYPAMLGLVEDYPEISVSVGVHPCDFDRREPNVAELAALAKHPKNVSCPSRLTEFSKTLSASLKP